MRYRAREVHLEELEDATEDRIECGVQFRAIPNPALKLPPHWVAEEGRPVIVFHSEDVDTWWVYAPLCELGDGLIEFNTDEDGDAKDTETRAFLAAATFVYQSVPF